MRIMRLLAIAFAIGFVWMADPRDRLADTVAQPRLLSDVFWTIGEGYLLNNFLPFRLGEIGRAFLLSRKSDMQFMEILPDHRHRARHGSGIFRDHSAGGLAICRWRRGRGTDRHYRWHHRIGRFRNTLFAGSLQSVGVGSFP